MSSHRWSILGVVVFAQLMVVLDATIVNIALPSAQRALQFSNDDRQWIVTAYALAFGSLLPLGGRLGDLFGRKRALLVGAVGFAAISAFGGFAQSFEWLLAARALQGTFGALLLAAFGLVEKRSRDPLLPLRVLADRNRGGSALAVLFVGAGMFGVFLFVTYYLQQGLHFGPILSGPAFLPMVGAVMLTAICSNVLLLERVGPRLLIPGGMTVCALGIALLTRLGSGSTYTADVLPGLVVLGLGMGLVVAPATNLATHRIDPRDAGVGSSLVNIGQQAGGSLGTALLNTVAISATAAYLSTHRGRPALIAAATVHGYAVAFWWSAAIFIAGAIGSGLLLDGRAHCATAAGTANAGEASVQPVPVSVPAGAE